MKRHEQIRTSGIRTGDLEQDLTPEQFGLIGRIAMAYNETELLVQIIYGICYGVSSAISDEFISRTNGLDSTVWLSRKAISEFKSLTPNTDEFEQSLTYFLELKKYRDAVIHSRMFHVPTGIGKGSLQKGSRSEVLLTVEALKGLYDRFVHLRHELIQLMIILIYLYQVHAVKKYGALPPDQQKIFTEPTLRGALAQYQEHRAHRLALKPLPTFPDLSVAEQGLDMQKAISGLLDSLRGEPNTQQPLQRAADETKED
jgi:hypothetical protein